MDELRTKILDAALSHIVFDGWSVQTIAAAAKSIGLTEFDARHAFPSPVDAIDFFTARADAQMLESLARDYALSTMKIRERIATCVMVRLRQQTPYREAIRRALGVYALPWNTARALKATYATVDAMWRAAGDTSTDYNFYTKRLLLSNVYATTVRVWLGDASPDLAETEAFLRRRIENVMQIEKLKARARDGFSKLEQWMPKKRA